MNPKSGPAGRVRFFFNYQMQLFGRAFHSCANAGVRCGSTTERWSSLFPVGARDAGEARHPRVRMGGLRVIERRHNLERGTLVLLAFVPEFRAPSYEQRRTMLETIIPSDAVLRGDTSRPVPSGTVM